ncbi:hypothetical protein XENOCAPTIV_008505 [Xenoophorus captivus]|uniref:Uncharacterized protein n=1 Tax=Xenoophorus captivus TaxID=1517983 RepID=A0ABV0S660_9TELE
MTRSQLPPMRWREVREGYAVTFPTGGSSAAVRDDQRGGRRLIAACDTRQHHGTYRIKGGGRRNDALRRRGECWALNVDEASFPSKRLGLRLHSVRFPFKLDAGCMCGSVLLQGQLDGSGCGDVMQARVRGHLKSSLKRFSFGLLQALNAMNALEALFGPIILIMCFVLQRTRF